MAIVTVRPEAALTEITAARIGLAHGVYTNPSAPPTSRPERNPSPRPRGPRRASRDSGASMRAAIPGASIASPKASSTAIATSRRGSDPSPTPSTTLATPTTVMVKVIERPSTMPSGRRRPPRPPADSSAGSTGSTHGDRAVPAPASSANATRTITPPKLMSRVCGESRSDRLYRPDRAQVTGYSAGVPEPGPRARDLHAPEEQAVSQENVFESFEMEVEQIIDAGDQVVAVVHE